MAHRRPLPATVGAVVAFTVAALLAAAPVAIGKPPSHAGGKHPVSSSSNPNDAGEGSCDVDGVTVSYAVSFHSDPAPARYRVDTVTVGDISRTCADATLTVTLTGGASAEALVPSSGPAEITLPSAPYAWTSDSTGSSILPPVAEDVVDVHVVLDGGQVPIPQECRTLRLQHVLIGTTGNDLGDNALLGTVRGDLIYGQNGDDRLTGAQQTDCLVGGPGNDTLLGDEQNDVLLGDEGNDQIDGGNGDNVVYGGAGDDTILGGNGKDELHGGIDADTIDGGAGRDVCYGDSSDTFLNCEKVVHE